MKGLKFLASCAAIGALTTICAVSSYAATATYVDGGTVNVTGEDVEAYVTAVGTNDLTLLVLDGTDVQTVAEGNILQINQGDDTILTGIKLDTTKLEAGKAYEVRIGGAAAGVVTEKGFLSTTFTMPGGDTPSYTLGDVDEFEGVDANDALTILDHVAEKIELSGDKLKAADVDEFEGVDANDALTVLDYVAEKIDKFPAADR